jgi:hypothetical protein
VVSICPPPIGRGRRITARSAERGCKRMRFDTSQEANEWRIKCSFFLGNAIAPRGIVVVGWLRGSRGTPVEAGGCMDHHGMGERGCGPRAGASGGASRRLIVACCTRWLLGSAGRCPAGPFPFPAGVLGQAPAEGRAHQGEGADRGQARAEANGGGQEADRARPEQAGRPCVGAAIAVPFAVTEPGGTARRRALLRLARRNLGQRHLRRPAGRSRDDRATPGDAGVPRGQRRQRGRAGRAPARRRPRCRSPASGGGHPPRRRVRAGTAGRALHRQHRAPTPVRR